MNNPHPPLQLNNQPDASHEYYMLCGTETTTRTILEIKKKTLKQLIYGFIMKHYPNIY